MRRGSRLLCIGIAACMMCGCGILPTEEEFDAAPLVKEYSDENVGKYTVTGRYGSKRIHCRSV